MRWRATQAEAYSVSRGPERVPEVSELHRQLRSLGVKDLGYFAEGLDCIQYAQASRAAIVLGWTGFIDLLQLKLAREDYSSLNAVLKAAFHAIHKKVGAIKTRSDLIDHFDDALLL